MNPKDSFQGAKQYPKSTDDWNRPSYWDDYYETLLAERDPWRRGQVTHRDIDLLIRMLMIAGELPRSSAQSMLDAGCGIALIPYILAYWGFQVTAIDSCARAVQVATKQRPSEVEMALCISIWEPCKELKFARELVNDPARSLEKLRSFHDPGGSVTYVADDWFAPDLRVGTFDVVHCRNSLRCSAKPYWRRSLRRFYELLAAGGMLLLDNINAFEIQEEVVDLLGECGFVSHVNGTSRELAKKYVVAMWPSG